MKELGILVGTGFDPERGGQKNITSALKSRGYFVKEVKHDWPRNEYVYFDEKYFFERNSEFESFLRGNAFGNGGMVQTGEDFLMISDVVLKYKTFEGEIDVEKLEKDGEYYEESKKLVAEKGEKEYGARVHIAPTWGANGDIDMYTLLLPKSKILIYDTDFGQESNKNKDYNKIAEKEGLKYMELAGEKSGVWYPLNSLVLTKGDNDLVVLDKNSDSLIKLLDKEGIPFIPVDFPQRTYPAGKINCQTNIFKKSDLVSLKRRLSLIGIN